LRIVAGSIIREADTPFLAAGLKSLQRFYPVDLESDETKSHHRFYPAYFGKLTESDIFGV